MNDEKNMDLGVAGITPPLTTPVASLRPSDQGASIANAPARNAFCAIASLHASRDLERGGNCECHHCNKECNCQ